MANIILYQSSIICGVLHFPLLLYTPTILTWTWALSIITSILNHGLTNDYIKWIDRLMIVVACYYDSKYKPYLLGNLSTLSYMFAKITKIDKFHLASHILVTIQHYQMVGYLNF